MVLHHLILVWLTERDRWTLETRILGNVHDLAIETDTVLNTDYVRFTTDVPAIDIIENLNRQHRLNWATFHDRDAHEIVDWDPLFDPKYYDESTAPLVLREKYLCVTC